MLPDMRACFDIEAFVTAHQRNSHDYLLHAPCAHQL